MIASGVRRAVDSLPERRISLVSCAQLPLNNMASMFMLVEPSLHSHVHASGRLPALSRRSDELPARFVEMGLGE